MNSGINIHAENIGRLLSNYRFNFSCEIELQNGIESVLKQSDMTYKREYHLTKKDRPDFFVEHIDGNIVLEIKIGGTKNDLLRQISRYLQHERVNGVFVIGTTYWLNQIPDLLNGKPVWSLRLIGSML